MPSPTYVGIANITLSASAASVTFSSISQAYRDLVLVVRITATSDSAIYMRFNSDAGTNYNNVYMGGNGSATLSGSDASSNQIKTNVYSYASGSNAQIINLNIMDYSATDKHKTVLTRANAATSGTDALAGRWANTAAITSIGLVDGFGTFAAGSTFALYGIAAS